MPSMTNGKKGPDSIRQQEEWRQAPDRKRRGSSLGLSRSRRWAMGIAVVAASVVTIAVGAQLGGRSYYLVSVLLVIYAIAPFFIAFELRRPQAREVVVLAVMCALAVVSRVAFIWIPHFKPMAAIVMLAAIALGARSGFLVGAVSALASGLIFGLGPWTPWQMLAFGAGGGLMGLLADVGVVPRSKLSPKMLVAVSTGGFLLVVLLVGPILDTCTLFTMMGTITPTAAAAVYLAGLPVNLIHGTATLATLLLAGNPLLGKLARVQMKYGLLRP